MFRLNGFTFYHTLVVGSLSVSALLSACGGGGASDSSSGPTSAAPVTPIDSTAPPSTVPKAFALSLNAAVASPETINLSWGAIAEDALFEVYRTTQTKSDSLDESIGSLANAPVRELICQTLDTSCVDTGLKPATEYQYAVVAKRSDGLVADEKTILIKTEIDGFELDAAAPELSANVVGNQSLNLRWIPIKGATHYLISGGNFIGSQKITGVRATDTGLVSGKIYTYNLQACSATDCTTIKKFSVNALGQPAKIPVTPRIVVSQVATSSITLRWMAPAWTERYELMRDGEVINNNLTAVDFSDSGLRENNTYNYKIRACNVIGCSEWSRDLRTETQTFYPIDIKVKGLDTSRVGGVLDLRVSTTVQSKIYTDVSNDLTGPALNVGGKYIVTIAKQPRNGQMCKVVSQGVKSIVATNNTVDIDCQTKAAITFATANVALELIPNVTITAPQQPVVRVMNTTISSNTLTGWGYSSSAPGVISVDATTGALTPISAGMAVIRVKLNSPHYTSGDADASYAVTVKSAPAPTAEAPVSAGANSTIGRVDLTQVFAQTTDSAYQVLVPNRQTMVRVYVLAPSAADRGVPRMQVQAKRVSGELGGVIDMTCPAQLPVASSSADLYEKSAACYATIDSAWVQEGMSIELLSSNKALQRSIKPRVNNKSILNLRLVPIRVGTQVPVMPKTTDVGLSVLRAMPFAQADVSIGNTLMLSVDASSSSLYSTALKELRTMNAAEGDRRHYYGVMPIMQPMGGGSYIAGLGYVGGWATAVGVQNSERTLLHEVGHNLNLSHAPCGGVSSSDPFYNKQPEAWVGSAQGKLSSTPIYNSTEGRFMNPTIAQSYGSDTDIMGYCNGIWFSEYGYKRMADLVAANNHPLLYKSQGQAGAVTTGEQVLYVSGSITPKGEVSFLPNRVFQTGQVTQGQGSYVLNVYTRSGRVYTQNFNPMMVGNSQDFQDLFFEMKIPRLDDIERMEVVHAGNILPKLALQKPSTATAQSLNANVQPIQLTSAGSMLNLRWNAARWPWAAVVHVAESGERTALTTSAQGGFKPLTLPADLPVKGRWEVSLSDGLNTYMESLPR